MKFKDFVRNLGKCLTNCPGCGSSDVSGGPPWACNNCGSMWQ